MYKIVPNIYYLMSDTVCPRSLGLFYIVTYHIKWIIIIRLVTGEKSLYKNYKKYTERFVQNSTKYLLSYVRYCMSKKSWPILYSNLPHKMDHNYKIGYGRKEFVQKLQNIYRRICPKQSTKYLLSYVRYCMSKKSWPILYSNLYYIKWIINIR